jgi:hypothetical protein
MKRNERLLIAINEVTELAQELMTRNLEEVHTADYLTAEEKRTITANTRTGNKHIETIWRNAEFLKKALKVGP